MTDLPGDSIAVTAGHGMELKLHHVFACASVGAPEAAELLDAGLVEGSRNVHVGQGTSNRRFFFERGFLELIWVHDEREAQSDLTAPTRLWDRWVGRGKDANPFGLCFTSVKGAGPGLPFPTRTYQPSYLTEGRSFIFVDGLSLSEPEIFLPSWSLELASPRTEPTSHPLGLAELRGVSVGLPEPASVSTSLQAVADAGLVAIHRSASPELVIQFMARTEVRKSFPSLGLIVNACQLAPWP